MNLTFCEFVRIASVRQFIQIFKNVCFPKNNMRLSMKKYTIHPFFFLQTKLTNFAVITNVVIKREYLMVIFLISDQDHIL